MSSEDLLQSHQEHLTQDYKMADTTFIDQVTVIPTDWLNDLNRLHYTLLADPTTTQEIIDALPIVTTSTAGTSSAADKTKLDGIGAGANVTSVYGRTGVVVAATSDYDAIQVDFDNTTSGLTATDTQAAIDEVEARVDTAESDISTLQSTNTFADGTKVFTSVASVTTDEDVTIAPGLSSDDMDFGFSVLGATNQDVRVGVRNLDGYSHTMNEEIGGFSENAQVASMTAPASNLLTIKVYNAHTAAQNITVRWWARKR